MMTIPKELKLKPDEIGEYLNFVAGGIAVSPGITQNDPEARMGNIQTAIALGFFLAIRQPELNDVCSQWWKRTGQVSSQELLKVTLTLYQKWRDETAERK